MTEISSSQAAVVDPRLIAANQQHTAEELNIRFNTFEEARQAERKISDQLIEGALNNDLKVGQETVGLKGYLDKVETTESDDQVIADSEAIAGLYLHTTDMVARNLKIMAVRSGDSVKDTARLTEIKTAKDKFLSKIQTEAGANADAVVDWCDGKIKFFPAEAAEYQGLEIDGKDPLYAEGTHADDFRPNIKVQRQAGAAFIMGYSDAQVRRKLEKTDEQQTKRIYLNPEAFATPEIFERVLQTANQSGLAIQLKMLQRAPELADAHRKRAKGDTIDALRGDGIVIYSDDAQANEVLDMVLAIAKDRPEAFVGRKTSKIPQKVAEGIAVGDEPTQMKGKSLTSHRVMIFEAATDYVRKSGKTGQQAKDLFRRYAQATAQANRIDTHNIAFNEAA